ncbi:hypothetical protein CLIBASIA_03120 [Candidatus Liberibacter asiaticus str. psy62]|uniref:Uncharacterized protein n=1 Tax=Liberibacter asiaticus (strain psy62) TaxID=537021 RepID=C6XFQ7_LIBAP|nr:hypothetical protein CLIBASIA_03120 [Candidatus Liberibacter asiaticus str. psy62]
MARTQIALALSFFMITHSYYAFSQDEIKKNNPTLEKKPIVLMKHEIQEKKTLAAFTSFAS